MTNWSDLNKLKECVGDTALEEELNKVDEHTAYMFQHKYSKKICRIGHYINKTRIME